MREIPIEDAIGDAGHAAGIGPCPRGGRPALTRPRR